MELSYHAHDNIRSWGNTVPSLGDRIMVDPTAVVLGALTIADDVSIWPHCSVRADMHEIRIGARSNIQDNSVLHITHPSQYNPDGWPLTIGTDVTVGHRAVLHGCTIGNNVLIGMGAIVMDGAVIEDEVIVAAGTLVTPGKHLATGYVYSGSPATAKRALTDSEREFLGYSAQNYVRLKDQYLTQTP